MGDGSVVIVAPKVLAIERAGNGGMCVIFIGWSLRRQYCQVWTPLRGGTASGHYWLWSPAVVVGVVGYEVVWGLLLGAGHWTAISMRGHGTERVTTWAVGHLVRGGAGAELWMEGVLGVFHPWLMVMLPPGRADHGHGSSPGSSLACLTLVLGRGAHAKLLAHQGVGEDRAVLQGVRLPCLDHPLPTCHLNINFV